MIKNGKLVGKVSFVEDKGDYMALTVIQARKEAFEENSGDKPFDEKFESWKVYVRGKADIQPKKYYEFDEVSVGISAKNGKPYVSVVADNVKEHVFDNNNNSDSSSGNSSNNSGNSSNNNNSTSSNSGSKYKRNYSSYKK